MYLDRKSFAVILYVNTMQLAALRNNLLGCFYDGDVRVLTGKDGELDKNGSNECKSFCQGFRYFGTESGEECFCGNELQHSEKSSDCITECAGNANEYCGGHWKIMIYDTWHKHETTNTESSQSTNPTIIWITTNSINTSTTTNSSNNITTYTQSVTQTSKFPPVENTNSVKLLYVLVPLVAGVLVATFIVIVVVCKRRHMVRKEPSVEVSNDVNYTAPYSTVYSLPASEITESVNRNKPLCSSGNFNINKGNSTSGAVDVHEIELEDYNIINLRSNNETALKEETYDHVQQYKPNSYNNVDTTYNKLKLFKNADTTAGVNNVYDHTDIGLAGTRYTAHNEETDVVLTTVSNMETESAEENLYINEAEYSIVEKS